MSIINESFVFYDNEIGVVWNPTRASLCKTSVDTAKMLENAIEKANEGKLNANDAEYLENYLEENIKRENIRIREIKGLKNRKTIDRVEFVMATECNLQCQYCYANGGNYNLKEEIITIDKAKDYIDALINTGYSKVNTIQFFGGEPLLALDSINFICEYIETLVKEKKLAQKPHYTVITNGTLISRKACETFKKNDISVTVSCDGPKEINDVLRVNKVGKGSYDEMIRGVEMLKSYGIPITLVEATYTKVHEKAGISRKDVKSFIEEKICPNAVLVADCEDGTSEKELLCETWPDEELLSKQDEKRISNLLLHESVVNVSCGCGYSSFVIIPNGDVYPCHFMIGNRKYRIGKICDGTLCMNQYESFQKSFSFTKTIENNFCNQCFARYTCTVCPAGMMSASERTCNVVRERQRKVLLNMAREGGNKHGLKGKTYRKTPRD